jgi:trans-aconitate 2-methyltransferase
VPWDPSQYLKFADHRLRPAIDLLNRIDVGNPTHIYDLGAGTGNLTQLLKLRWPNARTTGVDASEEMLTKARKSLPDIAWQRADLATWRPPERAEIIYSNAALHWVGNHDQLFPALFSAVAPRGMLAVQMPHNFSSPSHAAIAEAVRSGPWRRKLEPLLRPDPVAEAAFYFGVLAPVPRTWTSGRRSTFTCWKACTRSRSGPRGPG